MFELHEIYEQWSNGSVTACHYWASRSNVCLCQDELYHELWNPLYPIISGFPYFPDPSKGRAARGGKNKKPLDTDLLPAERSLASSVFINVHR